MIQVTLLDEGEPRRFEVVVREGDGETRHQVTMGQADFEALGGGRWGPERCVEAAFRFLLDREPKEAILPTFDLAVIPRYFPEFAREAPRYLAAD